ncbi:MAG: hypothetical protein ACJ8GN_20900 [Longimicrobiaceae bacterium]
MFNSDILEVAVGVIFVFILVSIICSAVREGIETKLKTRAAYLEHGIRELLRDAGGSGLASWLYDHPLIGGLYPGYYTPPGSGGEAKPPEDPGARSKGEGDADASTPASDRATKDPSIFAPGRNLPSYIPSRNFATALMDLAARGPVSRFNSGAAAAEITPQTIRANIQNIENPAIQRVLLTALDSAQGDLEKVRKELERWFDSSMDRVSGWYKRSTQYILFAIGLGVAIVLNVDTISIASYLYRHPSVRAAVVAQAEAAAENQKKDSLSVKDVKQAVAALDSLPLPIGWDGVKFQSPIKNPDARRVRWWMDWVFMPLFGWLLTGFAATMGAPFWFDVLNKVMVIRSTVKPREKSPEEGSEDRQPKPARDTDSTPAAPQSEAQPGTQQTGTQQPGTRQPAPASAADAPAPLDAESRLDGCEVTRSASESDTETRDENLPQAEGGIA